MEHQNQILQLLRNIEAHLAVLAAAVQDRDGEGPNFARPLSAYADFDWSTIRAEVIARDAHGATVVRWQDREYRRRTREKYGRDIWFSRGAGRAEDGSARYARLITFGEDVAAVEPLPARLVTALDTPSPSPARTDFYLLLSQAIRDGTLPPEDANALTRQANLEGFAAALETLRAHMAALAAP